MKTFLGVSTANEYGLTSASAQIAGTWEMAALDDGALACFEVGGANDGAIVDDGAPAPQSDKVVFGVNRADGGAIFSGIVDRASLQYSKLAAVSAVAKVMFVGAEDNTTGNLNAVTGAAGTWGLIIVDKSKEEHDTKRQWVLTGSYTATDTDQTIVDLMIAAWNADTKCAALATAAQGGDAESHYGMKLTAATAGTDFTVYAIDGIAAADIYEEGFKNHSYTGTAYGSTVANVMAIGDYTTLREEEKEGEARRGVSQHPESKGYFGSPTSMLNSSYTYVTYSLKWKITGADQNMDRESKHFNELIIAVYSSNANTIAALDNILAAL